MAVGAGSIRRVAKANLEVSGKTEQIKKEDVLVEENVTVENDKAVQQEDSLKELVQEKQVDEKKATTKKPAKKSTGSDKKTSAKKAGSLKRNVTSKNVNATVEKVEKTDTAMEEKKQEFIVEEENTQMNQVCHITEDLPIHLL